MTMDSTQDTNSIAEEVDQVDQIEETLDAESDASQEGLDAEQPEEDAEVTDVAPDGEEQQDSADDALSLDLAEAVLELELLREQKRSETRRLNAMIEEKLDYVVRLARRRRDRQLALTWDAESPETELALAVPDECADAEAPSEERSDEGATETEEDIDAPVPFVASEAAA